MLVRTVLARTLLAAACLATVDSPAPARAQSLDPVTLYPGNYTVLLENERVRVLDFKLARGARESMHAHPANVVYVLAPFKIRFTTPDGKSAVREAKAGEVLYNAMPFRHASENVGETDAHGLLVEMKEASGSAAATSPAASGAVVSPGAGASELLTAVTFIEGRPEEAAALREALLSITAPTREEPANLAYDLYVSPDHPSQFMRFEIWENDQGLETHKQYEHFKKSFALRQEKGWKTQITRWKKIGP